MATVWGVRPDVKSNGYLLFTLGSMASLERKGKEIFLELSKLFLFSQPFFLKFAGLLAELEFKLVGLVM